LEGTSLVYDYKPVPLMTFPLLAQAFVLVLDAFHKENKDKVMLSVYTHLTDSEEGSRFHENEFEGKRRDVFYNVPMTSHLQEFHPLIDLYGKDIRKTSKRNIYAEITGHATPRSAHSHFARQTLLNDIRKHVAHGPL
jgi:hypothetical protein